MRLGSPNREHFYNTAKVFERVIAQVEICRPVQNLNQISIPKEIEIIPPMQEISEGPALWMWDYLRRSGARGFFLALSGGADSCSVAALVASMAKLVFSSL